MQTEKKKFRIIYLLIFSVLVAASAVIARQIPPGDSPEYSEEELEIFVDAALEIMPHQQEAQTKMAEEIESNGLSVEKFNNILEAHILGMDSGASSDELESFDSILESIDQIQQEYQGIIEAEIVNAGMTPEKFEEILANYQQDPELQLRINQIMQTRTKI
jgi:hypothetical protein